MKSGKEITKVIKALNKGIGAIKKIPRWYARQSGRMKVGIMIGLLLFAWVFAPAIIAGAGIQIYEGGWEVRTGISSVYVNGEEYTKSNPPLELYNPWGDQFLKFDVDNPTQGCPNIVVDIGPPREYYVDAYGDWTPAPKGTHFDHVEKAVGDTYMFWDHYVFRYHVRVVAEPDRGAGVIGGAYGEAVGLIGAEDTRTTVRVKFTLDPFINRLIDGFETENGNYTLNAAKVFAGVMSAKVADVKSGFVGYEEGVEPDGIAGKTIIADMGGTLNQYYYFNPDDPPINVINVPTETYIDVGGELSPAHKFIPGWFIVPDTIYLYAVYYEYTVEVHCLATAGYDLEEGNMDDNLVDIDYDNDEGGDFIGEAIRGFGAAIGGFFDWAGAGLSGFLSSIGLGFLMPVFLIGALVLAGFILFKSGGAILKRRKKN